MSGNTNLQGAKKAKKDEFYTQMDDIAGELSHYSHHFRGKTVLCNCDDPFESNFFKYFALNFNFLGLKKLLCTCWDGSPITGRELNLFGEPCTPDGRSRIAYKAEITEVRDLTGDGATDLEDVKVLLQRHRPERLQGNGDFRSAECIELLKEADIVVTNPPFSLFREYVAQLMKFDKKFLIIGNQNAITYKEIFPLIKENKLWLGVKSGDMSFTVPEDYEERETRFWIDNNGQKWRSMGNICWFTNLDHNKRHLPLDLYKRYTPEEYPRYDNYDAINVDKTSEIPLDYSGVMGVPITFLDKYCPEQFEIVEFRKGADGKDLVYSSIGGGRTTPYFRILIRPCR
ncbi:MAG: adenine-specific methyltransferase EcoRI family protein [Porphyromonadaceae bacterium]|nr:adenine-specific methyltransferase EcoRI family protein [Porphyromonadaceae bacterium]